MYLLTWTLESMATSVPTSQLIPLMSLYDIKSILSSRSDDWGMNHIEVRSTSCLRIRTLVKVELERRAAGGTSPPEPTPQHVADPKQTEFDNLAKKTGAEVASDSPGWQGNHAICRGAHGSVQVECRKTQQKYPIRSRSGRRMLRCPKCRCEILVPPTRM